MAQTPLISRLVSSSVCIAKQAGKIIRNVREEGNLGIVEKGVNDFQTRADRGAEQCIVSSLSSLFPNVRIIGEENESSLAPEEWVIKDFDQDVLQYPIPDELKNIADSQVTVWVDPLDGTTEYTQGLLDNVTVLIGIAVDGCAIAGVIHQPYFNNGQETSQQIGRTIWGIVGAGTGSYKPKVPPKDRKIVVTTRSHDSEIVRNALKGIEPDEVIRVGGLGNKVLLLLEGRANAYVYASKGSKKWDTCAPEAVLNAAGGLLTDIHGKKYNYDSNVELENTRGVLATAKIDDHEYYLSRIPEVVRAALP